jgi:hypothetical protein
MPTELQGQLSFPGQFPQMGHPAHDFFHSSDEACDCLYQAPGDNHVQHRTGRIGHVGVLDNDCRILLGRYHGPDQTTVRGQALLRHHLEPLHKDQGECTARRLGRIVPHRGMLRAAGGMLEKLETRLVPRE